LKGATVGFRGVNEVRYAPAGAPEVLGLGLSEPSTSPAAIRVLIVDDDGVFRRGVREHLKASGFDVVGEAEDDSGAVALSAQREPDVILLDLRVRGGPTAEVIQRLRLAAPRAQVLLTAVSTADDEVVEAIMAGASGCLPKDSDGDQVLAAIRAAAAGESVLSPRIASALIERAREHEPSSAPDDGDRPALTKREREILSLIVEGSDNKEIAAELVISPETVKTHVSTVLEKLGAGNRVEAAVKAVRAGLA
jgi:DNA-binding NarL/FixJ family response regulator